ncbi:MAG: TRAP transporter large permease subunit, partial [Sphaerochaetaceae bacterium]|nr:TRAP transporter large permease subunit [Sphaerochaetaceae bacterium]
VTFFVYRDISLKEFPNILKKSLKTLSTVLILTSCATAFSFFITYLQVPQKLTALIMSISSNKYVIFLLINLILLLLGCLMNTVSIILIMTPIFYPIVQSLGMDGVQFGVMMILNLGIGLITPPVGNILFIGSSVSGIPVERLSKAVLPQLGVMFIALMLVTYIPALSMALPTLIYG